MMTRKSGTGKKVQVNWLDCLSLLFFFPLGYKLVYATGKARMKDELLGCTAPSHLPKSPYD